MELQSMRDDKTPMKITIKLTGDLARGDHHYLQLFNILVRRCLEHLQLQLVGRNYFDIAAKVIVTFFYYCNEHIIHIFLYNIIIIVDYLQTKTLTNI